MPLPRPRSQLPLLQDFSLPLPNTDEHYFPHEIYDPTVAPSAPRQSSHRTPRQSRAPAKPKHKRSMDKGKARASLDTAHRPSIAPPTASGAAPRPPTRPLASAGFRPVAQPPPITKSSTSTKPQLARHRPSSKPRPSTVQPAPARSSGAPPPPAALSSSDKLEQFRYRFSSDDVPPAAAGSSAPPKRPRPPKEISPNAIDPPRTKTSRSKPLLDPANSISMLSEKETKKRKTTSNRPQDKLSNEPVFFVPDVDEDGNPIESGSASGSGAVFRAPSLSPPINPCPDGTGSRANSHSPVRTDPLSNPPPPLPRLTVSAILLRKGPPRSTRQADVRHSSTDPEHPSSIDLPPDLFDKILREESLDETDEGEATSHPTQPAKRNPVSRQSPEQTNAHGPTSTTARDMSRLEQLLTAPPAPRPTFRLVPLTLAGLTSHLEELVSSTLREGSLARIGGKAGASVSDETAYLRREVSRLADVVVERDKVIAEMTDEAREKSRRIRELERQIDAMEQEAEQVETERQEEMTRFDWYKEARRGLIGIVKELEAKVSDLERRCDEDVVDDPASVGSADEAAVVEPGDERDADDEDHQAR
ncbi:hypothetical protein JCM10212_003520 [Sporobolomyces blumeae]